MESAKFHSIHGSMDAWIHGSMEPWIQESMDPWMHGSISMDPWIHRSMDLWILNVYTDISNSPWGFIRRYALLGPRYALLGPVRLLGPPE